MSSVLPHDCDALLPTAERYASLKYRRVARFIQLRLLDWYDLVELVAFVETIGMQAAKFVFHWHGPAIVRAYNRVRRHIGTEAEPYIEANLAHMGVDAGLAILRAMQDGGYTGGGLPIVVRRALKELRKSLTIGEISQLTGLTREQVKTACEVRRREPISARSRASAALAVG